MLKVRPRYLVIAAFAGVNIAALTLPFVSFASNTSNTAVDLTVNPVLISYSSGPTVTLGAITPTVGGLQSTNDDTVTANTNDSSGVTITMQENSATTTALVSGGNTIPTTSGTPASPIALTNDTWGWRMDSLAGFGTGPTSTISNAAPSALTFAAIPANGSPYTLSNTGGTGTTTDTVWYSARVSTSQPSGSYTSTVTYTFSTN